MKTFTRVTLTGFGASLILLTTNCSKLQTDDDIRGKKPGKELCDVAVFTQQYTNGENNFVFSKTYDLSGRRLARIDAPLFSGGGISSYVHLNITFDEDRVYFISSENSTDTGLVVHLNNDGRVAKVDVGQIIDEGFGPQEFFYQDDRLHLVNIDNDWMRIWFNYDTHGNNTQIVTDSSDGFARINHEFQYDYQKKISQHFYMDEARGFSFNVLTILHAAGFFPELNPVHARTRTTVHWGPYQAYDYVQRNHVLDKDRRLIRYETVSPDGGSTIATFHVNWNCVKGNKDLITYAQ
jgi:hypothetical protein